MRKVLITSAVLCLAFGLAGIAKADSIDLVGTPGVNQVEFTGSVTSTTVTLTVQCLDPGCVNWFLGPVALKGFTFTGSPSNITEPSSYTVNNGGANLGNTGSCDGTQLGKAVCWSDSTPFSLQLGSAPITFEASITGGVSGPLHVQAISFSTSTGQKGTRTFAISDDMTPTPTPEPASILLLGLGLAGTPLLRRRRS
jgi:hypothetical protein